MATYHDVMQEKDKNIRYLSRINIGLLIALTMAAWGWHGAQKDITLYYPPNMQLSTMMKAGVVPEETVYAFAPLILQQLHLWEKGGDQDYEANRYRLRQFMTETYQRQIVSEIDDGTAKGTLRGLKRRMQVLPTSVYTDDSVQVVGNHWLVWLDVEILDSIAGMEVNRGVHRMAVRVVRYDINRDANPWQLALDGIEQDMPLVTEKEARKFGSAPAGTGGAS